MNRRRFLTTLAAAPLAAVSSQVLGRCGPPSPWGQVCEVSVNLRRLLQAAQQQQQSQWCWAACVAMLFAHYGFQVSQQRIVSTVYGRPVDLPAFTGATIASQINRPWVDDQGRRFRARLRTVFDADAGLNQIDDAQIIGLLQQGHPLIMGTLGHAVMLAGLSYSPSAWGPRIVGGRAYDPWPGRGYRDLLPAELITVWNQGGLRFLASAEVG